MEHEEERGGGSKEEAQDKCRTDPGAERYVPNQFVTFLRLSLTIILLSGRKI